MIKVLDVTLRDGGCINNFNFGHNNIEKILRAQETSGVEMIEVGYLDENNGSSYNRTQYINEKVIYNTILKEKQLGTTYLVMMDYGKFNSNNLEPRNKKSIDGIRVAFHKKNMFDIVELGKSIIAKGYELYIQPMVTFRYSTKELLELIELVNRKLPDASGFYIVDSFGEMNPMDVEFILDFVDKNLVKTMALGLHSHNNLQLSFTNARVMLQFKTNRTLILDSSIMGMGKGAGNLNTELLLEYLNIYFGKNYRLSPLVNVMDEVISEIHGEYNWGCAPEYVLSSKNHCSPSYASYYYHKHMSLNEINEILGMIAENKRDSFDKDYAEELYLIYRSSNKLNK